MLCAGQGECFQSEGLSTWVSKRFHDKVLGDPVTSKEDGDSTSVYPILGKNITMKNLKEALWVRKCANTTSPMAITWIDLQLCHDGDDHDTIGMKDYVDPDDIPILVLGGGMQTRVITTEVLTRTKNKIAEHNKNRGIVETTRSHHKHEGVFKFVNDKIKIIADNGLYHDDILQ